MVNKNKIIPGFIIHKGPFWGAYFWRVLYSEGLLYGGKFALQNRLCARWWSRSTLSMDRRNQGQGGGEWTSQTAINCGCSHLTHLIVLWQKKKSCATKTFLLWFTLYLAVSKALGGWYSIGRFNGGFLFFALRVYGAYIWVTYFRNFTVWRSNENSTCNILSRITSEPQGQTLRSRRRNYVRIRDRRILMRWLWRSWFLVSLCHSNIRQ